MRDSLPSDGAAFVRRLQQIAPARPKPPTWPRLLLLALILAGFLRVMWALDLKDLWWDESLSLQRAESPWPDLLLGRLPIKDGLTELVTADQHPFFFFVLQGILIRLAGNDETVLRFPSVMAATLLIPVLWVWARRLGRSGIVPPGTALWAAGLAAAHPFFLWYGQEARPYALWAMLALLSTYCLWRALRDEPGWWPGAAASMALFYTTHYYAIFLLPVHALMFTVRLWSYRRMWALALLALAALGGASMSLLAYWLIIIRQGGGGNFPSVAWIIVLRDLLNAFSMGPSADITLYWGLDVAFGLLALLGAVMALRHLRAGGWLPPALVLVPILVLLAAARVIPAYMNARHMSLIGGSFILLAAAGLATLGGRSRMTRGLSAIVAVVLLGGMAMSSYTYFTDEEYAKDDYRGLGAYLTRRIAPGDLVLYQSPFAWRAFTYYVPTLERAQAAQAAGAPIAVYGVPLIRQDWQSREAQLDAWTVQYRRIWFIRSDTHPYMDLEGRTVAWLQESLFRVDYYKYFSHSEVSRALFLREVPVADAVSPSLAYFDDTIGISALTVDPAGADPVDGLALPLTIAWQALQPNLPHHKYILQLEELLPDAAGDVRVVARTEREPYDGAIPTSFWDPGKTIFEATELPPSIWPRPGSAEAARYWLTLQVYRDDTLEKLPVSLPAGNPLGATISPDGFALQIPYTDAASAGQE